MRLWAGTVPLSVTLSVTSSVSFSSLQHPDHTAWYSILWADFFSVAKHQLPPSVSQPCNRQMHNNAALIKQNCNESFEQCVKWGQWTVLWSRLGKSLDIWHPGKPDFPSAMVTLNLPPRETCFLPRRWWWLLCEEILWKTDRVYYLYMCDVRTRDAVFLKNTFAHLCSCSVWEWGYNYSTRGKIMTRPLSLSLKEIKGFFPFYERATLLLSLRCILHLREQRFVRERRCEKVKLGFHLSHCNRCLSKLKSAILTDALMAARQNFFELWRPNYPEAMCCDAT